MDLDFYVRVRACKKRVTGKQPLRFASREHISQMKNKTLFVKTSMLNNAHALYRMKAAKNTQVPTNIL